MSDQDFFFDEEEKPSEKQASAASKSSNKQASGASKSSAKQPAKPVSKSAPQQSSGMELTWTVTALIAIVALLLGVIVGYAIPKSSSTVDTSGSAATTAPQLSPDQLNSGQLPAGHPDISGGTGSSTGTATTP